MRSSMHEPERVGRRQALTRSQPAPPLPISATAIADHIATAIADHVATAPQPSTSIAEQHNHTLPNPPFSTVAELVEVSRECREPTQCP